MMNLTKSLVDYITSFLYFFAPRLYEIGAYHSQVSFVSFRLPKQHTLIVHSKI